MISWFNRILSTRTLKFFIWEEPKFIFAYQCMIGDCSGSSCTKRIRITKVLKPQTTSDIWWLKQIIITINKIEKMFALQVWHLKCHLPFINKVITFIFLAKVPRQLSDMVHTRVEVRRMDLWNDLGFSLCAVLFVCCVVTTSDDREKSKMEVSADWCVAVKYWRLGSIKVYLHRLSD